MLVETNSTMMHCLEDQKVNPVVTEGGVGIFTGPVLPPTLQTEAKIIFK